MAEAVLLVAEAVLLVVEAVLLVVEAGLLVAQVDHPAELAADQVSVGD